FSSFCSLFFTATYFPNRYLTSFPTRRSSDLVINLDDFVRRVSWPDSPEARDEGLVDREWLVTNGLGGYASGTISGACTRRYHGLLVASLPAPFGRQMMLNYLSERVRLPNNTVVQFGAAEHDKLPMQLHGGEHLQEFRM